MLQSLRSTDCRLLQGADAKPTVKFLYPRFLFLFLFFQITFGKKRVGQPNTTQPKWSSAGALLTACAPLSLESSRTLVRCFGGGASPAAPHCPPSLPTAQWVLVVSSKSWCLGEPWHGRACWRWGCFGSWAASPGHRVLCWSESLGTAGVRGLSYCCFTVH